MPASVRARRLLLWLLLCLAAAPAAAEPLLQLGTPRLQGETLSVTLTLDGFLDAELRESLAAGLPATLLLRWRLWESRENWWDRELADGLLSERIYCDLLEGRYTLFDARGRRAAVCADLAALEAALAKERPLKLALPGPLPPGRRFVLELEARLEPLSAEELRDLERWLAGSEDARRPGILGGLTGGSEQLLRRMAGLGGRSASARSDVFSGED